MATPVQKCFREKMVHSGLGKNHSRLLRDKTAEREQDDCRRNETYATVLKMCID
jgi:hypothetical protein